MQRQNWLQQRLQQELHPEYLQIADESRNHSVPEGAESHFRACIVSECFVGLSRLQRHRLVYGLVGDAFDSGLHALALQTFAPEEWHSKADTDRLRASPECLGGSQS